MLSRPYLAALVTVVVVLLWLGFGSGKKPDVPSPSPVNLPIQSPAPAVEHHASTPPPPPPKQPVMETFDVEVFLQTFQAANPTYQDYCVSVMRNSVRQSQFSQDMILFYNFFWRYAVEGRKGFYVDSGANEWKYISNTFFYDVCLGWEGLCIEPDIQYIDNLRQHRTCTTLNMCISAEKSQLHFNPDGAGGKVAENGNRVVDCDSLQALLAEKGRDTVDLWSLDVEGYELNVLGTVDFSAVTVKVLLVEDFWTNFCSLDKLLLGGVSGLMKWMKLPIDSIYIHSTMDAPLKRWLWPQYQADWTLNNNYRENHGLGTCN